MSDPKQDSSGIFLFLLLQNKREISLCVSRKPGYRHTPKWSLTRRSESYPSLLYLNVTSQSDFLSTSCGDSMAFHTAPSPIPPGKRWSQRPQRICPVSAKRSMVLTSHWCSSSTGGQRSPSILASPRRPSTQTRNLSCLPACHSPPLQSSLSPFLPFSLSLSLSLSLEMTRRCTFPGEKSRCLRRSPG